MDITNNLRKLTASLGDVKYRRRSGCFKAEGTKCVLDTIKNFELEYLFATPEWLEVHSGLSVNEKAVAVTKADLIKMSSLSTAPGVIAVYRMPVYGLEPESLRGSLTVALDGVQDPGNLGTVIRTADWFGVRDILCSRDTVDVYSPKVIQATMGAISRVRVHYCDLPETLIKLNGMPVYGTFLDGGNIYDEPLSDTGIIVMGNEGKGISGSVARIITDRLYIPPYPADAETSESLNVGVATAITLAEFRRRCI